MSMIKKLTRQGNSSALIIDKTMRELLDLDADSVVKVTVDGRRLIVEALSEEERAQKFQKVLKRTSTRHAALFRRLA